jgi:hypothetical protein
MLPQLRKLAAQLRPAIVVLVLVTYAFHRMVPGLKLKESTAVRLAACLIDSA